MSEIIEQAKQQTATEVLLDALNSIATETCDHGPGLCPREVAAQALADHDRILAVSQLDGPDRIRVVVRPGKDDWIGVAYSSSVERNDIVREYVKPQFVTSVPQREQRCADCMAVIDPDKSHDCREQHARNRGKANAKRA